MSLVGEGEGMEKLASSEIEFLEEEGRGVAFCGFAVAAVLLLVSCLLTRVEM